MYTWDWVWGKFGFLIALIVGVTIIAWHTPRRSYYYARLAIWAALFIGETFAYEPLNRLIVQVSEPIAQWWTGYFVHFIMSIFFVWSCYKTDFWGAMFCATAGYCMQHISQRMYYFVFAHPIGIAVASTGEVFALIAVTVVIYMVVYMFVVRKNRYLLSDIVVDNKLQVAVSLISCMLMIILNTIILSYISNSFGITITEIISVMCAVVILMLQFTMIKAKKNADDVIKLERLLDEKRVQYENERENMEMLNIKAHDLRHQLRVLNDKLDKALIEELMHTVDEYDGYLKTGNDSLDIIIAKGSELCRKYGIKFTCMLDGNNYAHIQPHELYALFGNAIENAVNAVAELAPDKKIISVTEAVMNRIVVLRIVNYFGGELEFENGLPVTHGDSQYHGFGVRSIQLLAEKYGGMARVSACNGVFVLEVMLPLPTAPL